ncbi:unnamed protein product [Orchesella dallaii]|uniref:TOG domain-containing protein n=1 Tax=Orchesella dallaii TaxID=48710 RepID=A0ABP1R0E7_9HEXA
MAEEEVDFSKLPLEERCTHKNWKARVSAYDELIKIFQKIYEDKHPDWSKYGHWIRKFPTDSNAAAQEKGLEVTLLYLQRAGCAGKIVAEVMSGVVSKCITASKVKTKELSAEIVMTCVEIERQEQVQEELSKGMEQKNPKVVAGCISFLTQIMRDFGSKVVNIKPLVKKIQTLCEDRDKTVREETKKLIIELYRWIGAALKPQLTALKPVMLQELDAEFEKLANEKPHPTRLLRSQQAKMEQIAQGGGEEVEEGEDVVDEVVPEIDPLDLVDPVDILSKLPKDFYEKCEAKKWQERKEAMEALEALVANPKLESGDYGDLVRTLKRLVAKDTNIVVVTLAGKCMAGIASGLKKKFSPYAPWCIGTILEKFKEKKSTVVAVMRAAIDASFEATNLDPIQEDVIAALQNKNPAVKTETCLFLSRAFAKTSYKTMTDKKLMKGYFTTLVANINESDPGVRDAAAEALGVALKHIGEKNMAPFISDLEQIKLQKVKEAAEKAVITAPKPAPEKKVVKPASAARSDTNVAGPPKKAGTAVKKPSTAPAAGEKRSTAVRGGKKTQAASPQKEEILAEPPVEIVGTPDARVDIGSLMNDYLMNEFNDKNWKVREEALDKVRVILHNKQHIAGNLGDLPQNIANRLMDSNKNLAVNAFLVCQNLAMALGPHCKTHIHTLLPNMLAGLSDSKVTVRAQVTACIDAWADNAGLQKVFCSEFVADALKTGNHHARTDLFYWIANRLPTMKTVSKDELIACLPCVYASIEARTPEVRRASIEVLVPIMVHLGYETMLRNTSKLKPASEKAVKAALDKARADLPVAPPKTAVGAGAKGAKTTSRSNLPKANKSGSDTNLSVEGSELKKPVRGLKPPTTRTSPNSKIPGEIPNGRNLSLNSPNSRADSMGSNQSLNSPKSASEEPIGSDFALNSPKSQRMLADETMMGPPQFRQNYAQQPQEKMHILPEKYRLDFETIDNMFRDEAPLTQLKLLDTNIDGIMKQKAPSLPTRRMVAPVAPTLTKDKSNKLPNRATQSIDMMISQVGHTDLRLSIEALTQLEPMISDQSIVQIMANRVDHMLSMASLQIHRLQATIESANAEKLTEVNRFYRCAVAFLTSLYKGDFLPQRATKETIKDLIQNLLQLIIDPSLEKLPDAAPIVRLINIMVVRIIEKSDPNQVTCALIRLLNETLTSSKQPRLLDLVMKCQWKLLKQFSVWEQWNYEWNVAAILTEFNLFMRNHPFSSFQGQDVTPLKTMKTILHALVVHLGGEVIAQHLSFMPEVQESEAGLYINKVIQREMGKKRQGQGNNPTSGTPSRGNNVGGGRSSADSASSNNVSGRPTKSENYNQVSNPNNNVNDFMNSLPDPSDAPTDEAWEQAYMQRVRMIMMRGGLSAPRGPSVTLSKNLNDGGGEESSI